MSPEETAIFSPGVPWSSLDEWWRDLGRAEVRLILWAAWDPIGHVPRDEYDSYLPKLWELLREYALTARVSEEKYEELSETERDEFQERVLASRRRIEAQLRDWRVESIGIETNPATEFTDFEVSWKLTELLHPVTTTEFAPGDLPA